MKHLKTYESLNPKIGDYITTKHNIQFYNSDSDIVKVKKFQDENIGKIIDKPGDGAYVVQYENIPKDIKYFFNHKEPSGNYKDYRSVTTDNITHFAISLDNLKIKIDSDKYNL